MVFVEAWHGLDTFEVSDVLADKKANRRNSTRCTSFQRGQLKEEISGGSLQEDRIEA
jgi:hypothetical protein